MSLLSLLRQHAAPHRRTITHRAMAAIAVVSLTGCGGGDGGSSGKDPIQAPVPTPSPSAGPGPSPEPPLYPDAPFGINRNQAFRIIGWSYEFGPASPDGFRPPAIITPLSGDEFSLSWSKAAGTYVTSAREFKDGLLYFTFPGNNPSAFTVADAEGEDIGLHMSISDTRRGRHAAWVHWSREIEGDFLPMADGVFGIGTSRDDMPKTGIVTYSKGTGAEETRLRFDFDRGIISGVVSLFYTGPMNGSRPVQYDIEQAVFSADGTSFSARFQVPDAPEGFEKTGEITGIFLGPNAEATGYAIKGVVKEDGWDWWTQVHKSDWLNRY